MKLKEGFILRKIEDVVVAVPTGKLVDEFPCIINLNKTGEFIWKLLENETTLEKIIKELIEKYSISEEEAKKIADEFIEELRNSKFLQE